MSWKIKRQTAPVRSLSDHLAVPVADPLPAPTVPKEDIVAAVQVIACKDGKVYISAPADTLQGLMLLIDGMTEVRNRFVKAMEAQQQAQEKVVLPFPAGVIPR
jgi:hypothetical protein